MTSIEQLSDTIRLIPGDAGEGLKLLPAGSVHTCVTSPPYFGLRSYLPTGHEDKHMEIGLEETPTAFVEKLVGVFREVRRVLRDDGTIWVNIGDSYAGGGGFCATAPSTATSKSGKYGSAGASMKSPGKVVGVKTKDLIGVPWMLAFALRADGWWLRQDIIWAKPGPMPESVQDRCTKSHEYIFLLSKSERYYFDAEAIAEPANRPEGPGNKTHRHSSPGIYVGAVQKNIANIGPRETRNKRSVWTVNPAPSQEKHYASYPPKLIEPCILAGAPKGGTVLDPFGGTGTTAFTAARLGRSAVLTELSPEYCGIIRRRVAEFEGTAPGQLFSVMQPAGGCE